MRPARAAFVAAWLLLCLLAGALIVGDRLHTVEALGVPTMQPRFADVRPITGAGVALAQGLDPLRSNPGDPWNRALNYPRVWLLPARLGVGPEHSEVFAIVLLLLFAGGLLSLLPLATNGARTSVLVAAMFSPVTWLAVERANNDVLVFALLAAAAATLTRRPRSGATLLGIAAALKLYPIFAIAALAGAPRRAALWLTGLLAAAFAGYLLLLRSDLAAIRDHSLAWNRISYGITQLPDALAANTGWPRAPLLAAAIAAVAATTLFTLPARRRIHLPATDEHALAAFRVGAAVFLGTFCLGSNFDYRLLCLLLTVPQLVDWCTATRGRVRLAVRALTALVPLLLWSMTWRRALAARIGSEMPGLMLDEVLTWGLVAGLLVTLVLSLPGWLLPRWSATSHDVAHAAKTA